jgi:hypothetical protein
VASGQYIDVPSIAQAVLIGVVAHFSDAGVELPDRQVIAPGETRSVAWDCEGVVVTFGGLEYGQASNAGGGAKPSGNPINIGVWRAAFVVQIIRCAVDADGGPADPEKLTEAGIVFMKDAALLALALSRLCGPNGPLRRSGMAELGPVNPLGPADFTAVEGSVTVTAKNLA